MALNHESSTFMVIETSPKVKIMKNNCHTILRMCKKSVLHFDMEFETE
jgi:hypothetical protein